VKGEFNSQVRQWDSLSLQRSEMFIATTAHTNVFAPLGAKPVSGTTAEQSNAIALLRSAEKKESLGYKHFAPLGRRDEKRFVALQT
jgi:hypothetical protein